MTEEKEASDPNQTREDFITEMATLGFVPRYPADNELQLDIDNLTHKEAFKRSFEILQREIELEYEYVVKAVSTPSRGGVGEHIRIQLPFKLTHWERIAWQAALGSDPVRELLSCLRLLRGDTQPTMLIEKAGL